MSDKTLENKLFEKCVKAEMCDKGQELWDDKDRLVAFAKQECEFLFEKRPLTHNEMLQLFSKDYLNKQSVFIDQELSTLIESEDVYSLIMGCNGIIRVFEDSSIINIGDKSDIEVRIFSEGLCTIRLYTDSNIDIVIKSDCQVIVFNYGGTVRSIQGDNRFQNNILIKNRILR